MNTVSLLTGEGMQTVIQAVFPAVEQHRHGDWELRHTPGITGTTYSSIRINGPLTPNPDDTLTQAAAWYHDRSTPPVAQLVADSPWLPVLLDRGWWIDYTATIWTTPTRNLATTPTPTGLHAADDSDCAPHHRSHRFSVTTINPDTPAEVGHATVTRLRGVSICGVSQLLVSPPWRNTGIGRFLMGCTARWAEQHGTTTIALHVLDANPRAQAFYTRLGFAPHHQYLLLNHPDDHPAK